MQRLIEGFHRFRRGYWRENAGTFEALARGQSPRAMVIACSDSRVDPQMIFDTAPGEIFVLRNIANLVPPYQPDAEYHGSSAAIEFAVRTLKVADLVVMGHSGCGGVAALLGGDDGTYDFVSPWMRMATPARERALASAGNTEAARHLCEYEVVKVALANLLTFPWLAERVTDSSLKLHGCWFDIEHGGLHLLGPDGNFRPV